LLRIVLILGILCAEVIFYDLYNVLPALCLKFHAYAIDEVSRTHLYRGLRGPLLVIGPFISIIVIIRGVLQIAGIDHGVGLGMRQIFEAYGRLING
jgi:hypothetical protein